MMHNVLSNAIIWKSNMYLKIRRLALHCCHRPCRNIQFIIQWWWILWTGLVKPLEIHWIVCQRRRENKKNVYKLLMSNWLCYVCCLCWDFIHIKIQDSFQYGNKPSSLSYFFPSSYYELPRRLRLAKKASQRH